jgi:cell division transport system ATP-binding protein
MSIRFEMVSKRYAEGREALTDISFEIGYGEMVYVTGHSGAGKSTLLKLLALIERPSEGTIEVFSKRLSDIRRRGLAAYRRRLGLVFQDHRLLLDRNAYDNVALPMRLDGVAETEIALRVPRALDQVGLGGRESALPRELSTGEQQRLGIARAMVGVPDLLLADEPTGNLDPKLAAEIMALMISLKEQGTTVIIASHDLPLIQRMRKRTLVLDGGRLIDDFRPEDWYGRGG